MLGFNHVAGGFAITGIGASLFDVNIFSKPEFLGIIWVASILPDIDHTKSIVGKCVYPLAKYIDRNFGHRTITHSLVCWLGITVVLYLLEQLFFKSEIHSWIFSLAYFSHLLLDMCTLQGIPLFYPFSSDMCVLPANPKLRVQTNDLKTETLIFLGFCVLLVSMIDLITAGLTPSFNAKFRSYTYLLKEVKRTGKTYKITYQDATGEKINATVVEAQADKATIYNHKTGFAEIKKTDYTITEINPTNTRLEITTHKFIEIEKDSLEKILKTGAILELEFTSTQPILYFEKDLQKISKSVKIEKVREFSFNFAPDLKKDTSKAEIKLRIEKIQNNISQAQTQYQQAQQLQKSIARQVSGLEKQLPTMDNYQKTKAIQKLKDLRKELEKDLPEIPNTANQQAELEYLQNKLNQSNPNQKHTFTGKTRVWKSYSPKF